MYMDHAKSVHREGVWVHRKGVRAHERGQCHGTAAASSVASAPSLLCMAACMRGAGMQNGDGMPQGTCVGGT